SHEGGRASARQPQLELRPFDRQRLSEVALKLREIYPTADRARLESKITTDFVAQLVNKVTEGFRGDVGVVPRQFLRQLVDVLDMVEDDPTFDPMQDSGFKPKEPTEDEQRVVEGKPPFDPEPEDDKGYEPAVVEF
ncbi:MAG: BREX system ATP-binding domain-containing protein, partial [Pseudomonadota bacterium]